MDEELRAGLERARGAATRARAQVASAAASARRGDCARRRREIEAIEDLGRSAVLECLEAGDRALALATVDRLVGMLDELSLLAERSSAGADEERAAG